MILQLCILLLSLFLFAAWGLPVIVGLRVVMPAMIFSAPAFGAAVLAFVSTVLVVFGISLPAVAVGATVLSPFWLFLYRRIIIDQFLFIKNRPVPFLLLILFSFIICSPILGGLQFTVFQGNHWDHLNYITDSAVFSRMGFDQIRDASQQDYLLNPLLPVAQGGIYARPTVSILFAVVGSLLPGSIGVGGYAFLCSFAISGLLAFYGLLLQLFVKPKTPRSLFPALCAGAYACGFWGQYPLDIDAWSQVAIVPLLLSAWAIVFTLLCAPAETVSAGGGSVWALIMALAILIAGGIYLYPEAVIFHALILLGVVVSAGRLSDHALRVIGPAILLGFSASFLFWNGTLGFAAKQFRFATLTPVTWWTYFDSYIFGIDPAVNTSLQQALAGALTQIGSYSILVPPRPASVLTGLSGTLGAYFLTPKDYVHVTLLDFGRYILLFFVFFGLVVGIRSGLKSRDQSYRLTLISAGVGLLGAMLILQIGQAWSAGKALSYAAPLLCLVIVAPAMIAGPSKHRTRLGPVAWMFSQACFAGLTLYGLSDPNGIRMHFPYPEIQDPTFKSRIRWDISDQLRQLKGCRIVKIVAPNPFYRQFASIALYERGQPYFYDQPVNTYYGTGLDVGQMSGQADGSNCDLVQKDWQDGISGGPTVGFETHSSRLSESQIGVRASGGIGADFAADKPTSVQSPIAAAVTLAHRGEADQFLPED